jgi:hypothetical protein
MAHKIFDQFTYRPVHVDHLGEHPQLKPGSVRVVAGDPGCHHQAKGKRGEAADISIPVRVLLELVGLFFDLVRKSWIFVLVVLLWRGVLLVNQIQLEGVFQLVYDLLKQFLFRGTVGILPGVSGD